MTNLIIPVGVPGSGKSTWAHTFLHGKYSIISTDEIRVKLFGSLRTAHDVPQGQHVIHNDQVFKTFHETVFDNLHHSIDTYADATNLRTKARKRLYNIAQNADAQVKVHLIIFNNVSRAWDQNTLREKDRVVPEEHMVRMTKQFWDAVENINEGVDDIPYDTVTRIESFS